MNGDNLTPRQIEQMCRYVVDILDARERRSIRADYANPYRVPGNIDGQVLELQVRIVNDES